MLPQQEMFDVVSLIAAAPLPEGKTERKLTFAGGEPTLCTWLPKLIDHAKEVRLATMLVTNGSPFTPAYLERLSQSLDWITLSIDSLDGETNRKIGRHGAKRDPLDERAYSAILETSAALGIRTKVKTVVNRFNAGEDMSGFICSSGIERWKVLQVMSVTGLNDAHVDDLAISRQSFDAYLRRHRSVSKAGIRVVPEAVDAIRGSYAMIDPHGRFFDSSTGGHRYSRKILDYGVEAAFSEVSFNREAFEERGGSYEYSSPARELALSHA